MDSSASKVVSDSVTGEARKMVRKPKSRPVFIAALPREIAPLLKSGVLGEPWKAETTHQGHNIHVYSTSSAILAWGGMGAHRASLAIEAALTLGPALELISVGWAGACSPRFTVGDAIRPGIVIDAQTGERFFISEPDSTDLAETLVTVASPAGIVEKERLVVTYYADAADMEAAAVARVAQAHELPFSAIKAISDDADFGIPDMHKYTTPHGQIREVAYGIHVILTPSLWSPVMTLARGSKLAAERLRVEIEAHIQKQRDRQA